MTVSDRPDPAVRRPPPKMTVDGDGSFRELSVSTINSREKLCEHCWNIRTQTLIQIRRDWFVRGALVVAVLIAGVCAWLAWDAHSQRAEMFDAIKHHKETRGN